jgi:hypothetical protein
MFQIAHSKQFKPFSAKPVNDAGQDSEPKTKGDRFSSESSLGPGLGHDSVLIRLEPGLRHDRLVKRDKGVKA